MHQALKDLSIAQKEESRVAKKEHSATTELEKALQAQEKARIVLTKAEADLKAAGIRVEKARKEADDMAAAHQRAIGETQGAKDKLDQVQATFSEKKEERNERLAALGSRNISPTSSNNSSTVGVNRSASQRYASGSSLGPGGAAIGRSTSASSGGSGHRVAAPVYTGETVTSPIQASPTSPIAGATAAGVAAGPGGVAGGEVRRVAAPEYGAPSPVSTGSGSMGLAERAAHDNAAAAQGYPTQQQPVQHVQPILQQQQHVQYADQQPVQHVQHAQPQPILQNQPIQHQQVPQIQEPVAPAAQMQARPVPPVPDVEPRTVKTHPPIIGGSPEGVQSHPPIIGGAQQQPGAY